MAGAAANHAAPGEPGVVIAQTPAPNAAGVERPRVSLLLSEPEEAESPQAFVMPSLAGLTLAGAAARAYAAGLRIVSAEDLNTPAPATAAADASGSAPVTPGSPSTSPAPTASTASPAAQSVSIGTVIAQTPPVGHRVVKGDPVHITLTN